MSRLDEQRLTQLARLHKIARINCGGVLSLVYINNATPLEFECGAGHRFVSRPMRIFAGRWCSRCDGPVRRSLHDCAEWARAKHGECLALVYVHANYPLRWRCADGHEWMARPNQIRMGGWCPYCAGHGPRTSRELAAIAHRHGGTCLTTHYDHYNEHLRWRCAQGHEFTRTISDVRRGRWCQPCLGHIEWSLSEMQRLAREQGGVCLSRQYENTAAAMRWRCAEGHTWSTSASNVIRGTWCAKCRLTTRSYKPRLTLADMHATAASHGGECLSARYRGAGVALRWRCAAGHTWMARPNYVRLGWWCVRCKAAAKATVPVVDDPPSLSAESEPPSRTETERMIKSACGIGSRARSPKTRSVVRASTRSRS